MRVTDAKHTPEQRALLAPRHTGFISGKEQYEEIVGLWFEEAPEGGETS